MDKQNVTAKEREKELKNEAKQKAKKRKAGHKKGRSDRIVPIVEKVIAAVLALALIYGIGSIAVTQTGLIERTFSVAKVGNTRIPITLYNYAYRQTYANLFEQYSKYYSFLKESGGYDIYKAPSDQKYTASAADIELYPDAVNWKTWADVLEFQTLQNLKRSFALYILAQKTDGNLESSMVVTVPVSTAPPATDENGNPAPTAPVPTSVETVLSPYNKLTDEEKKQLDEEFEHLRLENAQQNLALNAYLANYYGRGFTEKVFREQLTMDTLGNRLLQGKLAEFKKEYTDKKCTEFFNADTAQYGMIDYLIFTMESELPTQKDGEKDADFEKRFNAAKEKNRKNAQSILDKISDEESYKAQAAIQGKRQASDPKDYKFNVDDILKMRAKNTELNAINETPHVHDDEDEDDVHDEDEVTYSDAASWAFDQKRKKGDFAFFMHVDGTANYIYILRPVFAFVPVSIREIKIVPETGEDGSVTGSTTEQIDDAYDKAQEILEIWKKGEKTSESFADLAVGNSSGDTAEDGGLVWIDSSTKNENEVYLDWSLNPSRKPGDTALLTYNGNNFILYFEKKEKAEYFETIADEKSAADYSDYEKELLEKDDYELTTKSFFARWATRLNEKWVRSVAMPMYISQYEESQSNSGGDFDWSSLFGG